MIDLNTCVFPVKRLTKDFFCKQKPVIWYGRQGVGVVYGYCYDHNPYVKGIPGWIPVHSLDDAVVMKLMLS